jgi:ubiquinone/menaquinone biosynthesis C-methylase UbiE
MECDYHSDKDRLKGYTGEEDKRLFTIWADSLREGDLSLEETLARELADYFGQTPEEVRSLWLTATARLKEEWEAQNPRTPDEIIRYYDQSTTYIYELTYWHTLDNNDGLIQNAKSLELALSQPGRRYLDFGGGTGSNIILFVKHGFDCTLADISSSLMSFARWRLARRGIPARIVDLKVETLPDDHYDFVTVVDILEHTVDPVAVMRDVVRATRPGGLITAWVPFFKDEDRPMHLVQNMDTVNSFLSLGLSEISSDDKLLVKVYRKL